MTVPSYSASGFSLRFVLPFVLRLHLIAYRLLSLLHSFTPEVTTLLSYTSYLKIYLILLTANTERTGDLLLLFVLIYLRVPYASIITGIIRLSVV